MVEQKESYWSKHHWAIFQWVTGMYCATFTTWERFYPGSSAQQTSEPVASTGGAAMTHPYAMPFWLWLGIIAFILSFLVPNLISYLRKRKLPPPVEVVTPQRTPQNLRNEIAALAGDLCGYLIAHGRELNPPDDPSTNGFEVIPEEPDIIATFEREFSEQLMAVRTGLGNVGMLLGDTGEILEDGALHADDVRRIIDRLVQSIGLLDSRFGTKPAEGWPK